MDKIHATEHADKGQVEEEEQKKFVVERPNAVVHPEPLSMSMMVMLL